MILDIRFFVANFSNKQAPNFDCERLFLLNPPIPSDIFLIFCNFILIFSNFCLDSFIIFHPFPYYYIARSAILRPLSSLFDRY